MNTNPTNPLAVESADWWRFVSEQTGVGYWSWDIAADRLEWSATCKWLFGLPIQTELTYEMFLALLHPKDRAMTDQAVRACLEQGRAYDIEYRVHWPDGSVHWLHAKGGAVRVGGQATCLAGVVLDITERKTLEANLRAVEQESAVVVTHASEVIAHHDLEQRLVWANPAYQKATAQTVDQLRGQKCYRAWGLDQLCVGCPVTVALATGQPAQAELTPQNQPHWPARQGCWAVRAAPVRDAAGDVIGAIEIAFNITEQKRIEAEIRELNTQLEQRVAERTAQLTAALQELETFSYSASHDLRAPLRHLQGFASLLLQRHCAELSTDARDCVEEIARGAATMGQLVDDLLAFAKVGHRPLQRQPIAPATLVREIWAQLAPERQARPVEFHVGELPPCQADPVLLRCVWQNLLQNALKFSRGRTPARIEVSGRVQEGELVYCVQDNGVGFDMRYVGKLFGVFQRLHRAEDYEGTGIGLATVQRIIQRHGGRVRAEGELNRGASFHFSLPGANP